MSNTSEAIMKVDFYFDPSCPFCWITSRWILQAQTERSITITWKPFSLAIKNDYFGSQADSPYAGSGIAAHRVLRVLVAAKEAAPTEDLYTAFGTQKHIFGEDYSDELIRQVLKQSHLEPALAAAADDASLDKEIQASMDEAIKIVGNDIGTPTLVFHTPEQSIGYYGPILDSLPGVSESIKLWDALSTLAATSSFYELKRNRPDSDPNTGSTAVCMP